jgi:hypothetical protein
VNAHEAVLSAAKSVLEQLPALADGGVTRARRLPLATGKQSVINVYFGGSLPARGAIRGAPIDWGTLVRVECIARAAAGQTADQAALELHAKAWERLMANQGLSGLASDMVPGPIEPSDEEVLDTAIGCVIGSVQVAHRTAENSLEPLT